MTHGRMVRWTKWMLVVAAISLVLPSGAWAQAGRSAGIVSARILPANDVRGKLTLPVEKDMKVLWNDKIVTDKGGRVRVRLDDGSILNIGSQSQLLIQEHDSSSGRTQLQLAYGRMRASVVRITNPSAGGFQVRTTAAVAGVVGTDLYNEANEIVTTVVALGGGDVRVGSSNPAYADFTAILSPGEAITMVADQRPGQKRLATDEEIGNAYSETDSDEVVNLNPRATSPGQTIQARIVGKGIGSATAASFAREGLSIQATGPATPNGLPVSITVAANVPLGTYPFTVQRPEGIQIGILAVTTEENARRMNAGGPAAGAMHPPAAQDIIATRGAKFILDASATQTPPGTSLVAYLWRIVDTRFTSNTDKFTINTSLLPPKDYVIQLVVVNDRGQFATQRYTLTVEPGLQPAEIIRDLASGYESLQPNQFLKHFDEERFRNYSGFASAIEDSFRNQLEAVRVFQRPVNCTINEENDQAVCQADFEVQFTKKDQPTEFLDASGNPFPPGVAAPPGTPLGKRLLTGTERTTIRFERADKGWKITDYAAEVSCPGGSQVSGLNVGSCILAIGTFSSPGFTVINGVVTTSSGTFSFTNLSTPILLPIGGTLTGTFDVSPLGGFNGAVDFSSSVGNVLGSPVTATFSPNPASAGTTVSFTIIAPTTTPLGFTGSAPFTFTITGTDTSGTITQTVSLNLVLTVPSAGITLNQFTSPTAPLTLLANSSAVIGITAACTGSTATCASLPAMVITFGPLPAGVTVSPTTATIPAGTTQPFTFSFAPTGNQFANFGVANITVTATPVGGSASQAVTSTIVLNLGTAGSLPFSLFPSPTTTNVVMSGTSLLTTSFNVFVSSQQTFNQPINISVGTPPLGVTISPSTFVFTPGLSGSNVFYTVTIDPTVATPGSYPVNITGVSGGISSSTIWTLDLNGSFSVSTTPNNTQSTPLVLPPDGVTQNTVTVTVTSINNFSGSVSVNFSNPFGTAVTVTPGTSQSINVPAGGSANAVFTLVAASGAASTGTTQAFISASTGFQSISSSNFPFLTIGPAGFNLSPTSQFTTVDINSTFAPTLVTTVLPLGNFSASVDFTVVAASVPAGVSVSPTTQRVAAGGQARFTIRAATPAVVGNFAITVNAVSGTITQTFTMNVRLRGQITLNVTQSPGGGAPGTQTVPLVLPPSGTLTFSVSVGGIDGFSGSTTLQVFSLPGGVTGAFTSSGTSFTTINAPGTDTLTLTNVSAASAPLFTSGVQAFDNTNGFSFSSPSQQIYFTTGTPSFVLGCSFFFAGNAQPCNNTYLRLNINNPGGSGTVETLDLQVDSVGGYSGTVSVTPVNMPAGITMSPNPVILSPGRPTTVRFTAATPAVAGRWSGFTLVGNDTVTPTLASSTSVDGQLNGSIKLVVSPATTQNTPSIVTPGGQQTFTVDVFGMNGFSGTINLDFFPSLASGTTSSPSCCTIQVTVPPSGSVTATVTINATANAPASFAEPISFNATGFDINFNNVTYFVLGETNATSYYVVGPSTFNASISGATLTNPLFLQVGQQAQINVSISAIGAFTGTVFLDVTGLPCMTVSSAPGTSATIPVTAGPGFIVIQPQIAGVTVPGTSVSSTLFFTASSSCPRGFVQGTLTATSGALVQSIPLAFFITPQVSLSLTPTASPTAPMVIAPGSSGQLQIAANANPSFSGDVDLTFSLPSGVTITPNSAKVTLGGFTSVTVNLASTVSVGSTVSFTINAFINNNFITSKTATIIAGSGAFSISVTPATALNSTTPLVINAGSSGQVGVAVAAIGNFTGSVAVSASFTVTSLSTATPSITVAPGGTANFTVDAAAGAQGLIARMFVNASGGGQSASAIVYISIGSGGFSLSVSGNSSTSPITADLSSGTSFSVLVHQQSGFTGTVSLSAGGFPAGVSVVNNNFLVPAGTAQSFQLQIASNATVGDTQFTVTGTSGALTVNLTVFLRIRGQFSLTIVGGATPTNPLVVAPGSSGTVDVQVVPVASFFGTVQVSVSSTFGLPSGVTVTPSSATAAPGTPATFTISAAAGTPASNVFAFSVVASGTYGVASNGSSFVSASVYGTVSGSPTFNMTFPSPLSLDIGNQFGNSVRVQLNPVGGFAATVTLAVNTSQLPAGVTVNLPSSTFLLSGANVCPNTGQIGTCINLSFIAGSNVTNAGQFNVDITATSGNIAITQTLQLDLLADFNITVSPTSTSTAPIVLPTTGSQNFTLTMTTSPPNLTCNGQPYTVALSLLSTPPTGVTVSISPTVTSGTPATATVTTNNAPATGVFNLTGSATGPAGCTQGSGSGDLGFFTIGPPSFSLSVPSFQTGVNINQNSLSSVGVSVNAVGNFAGTVNVSVVTASVPAGVTVTPTTASVTPGNSITFQVRADSPATAGSASFNIQATDGTTTLNGTIPLLLRGSFTLTISPANSPSAPAIVAPGQSVNYGVSVTPQNGFSGTVNIFGVCCSSPPPGVTLTGNFSATPSSPATITVTASATAVASQPQGVTFCSSSANSFSGPCFAFYSAVGPAGFRVTQSPSTSPNSPQQMVINGSPRNITVFVSSLGGFTGTVNLALGSLPAGLTASPQTAQVTVPAGGSASFTFSFQAGSQLVQGPYDIQLTASQGATSVNTFFYLYAASNMALIQSPASTSSAPLRIINGDPIGQTVSVQVLNQGGFTGSVTLTASFIPTGMTVTPLTATVAANGSVNFQITAQNATGGLQNVTISASFSGLFATTDIWLNVGVGSFVVTTTPPSSSGAPISLDPNGTMVVPIAVNIVPQNGFVGTVDITPAGVPAGVTVNPTTAQVVVTSTNPVSTTFNFSATVAQGITPIGITFNATANVSTPAGVVVVSGTDTSFLLVNPPTFSMGLTGGQTSGSALSIEQGIPPGANFQVSVSGTGTAAISFANVPTGVNISPPTANVAAGSSATFTVDSTSSAAIGNYIISIVGTSSGQTLALNLFVNVVTPTNGFFLSTNPPTSQAAPVILQPDHTLVTFLDVNVQAKGTFTGAVALTLASVPAGVTATLTPTSADLSLSPSQVVQLQFQTTTGMAAFGPVAITVNGTSAALTASTPVWIALQTVSAIKNGGGLASGTQAPQIDQVLPPEGAAGSHMLVTVRGSGLSSITNVMSSSTKVSAQLEAAAVGSDTARRLNVFLRPDAPQGMHTLMLVSPRGSVPVGINVIAADVGDGPVGPGRANTRLRNSRLASRLPEGDAEGAVQPVITRIEPSALKPGQVVEGTIYGENLQGIRSLRAAGLGVSIEIVEARPTQLKVRFNVAVAAASGSRMLTLQPAGAVAEAMLNIQGDRVAAPPAAAARNTTGAQDTDAAASDEASPRRGARVGPSVATAAAPADLVVQSSDITMSPASPRPGDNVTFRVQIRNRGGQNADNVEVEFTLNGASVRVRDRFSVVAGGSQSFQIEWQAVGSGRFEPKVVIDPDRRLSLNSATTQAAMPAFEMMPAAGAVARGAMAIRERGQLTLAANGCQGFRFNSGTEQSCNGGADMEVRLAPQGGALRIEADGVRNLGAMTFESPDVEQSARGAMGTSETVLPGNTYLVQTRRGAVLVRVMSVRGLNSVRAAAPSAMDRPGIGDLGDRPRGGAAGGVGSKPQSDVTLVLEWRALSQ